MTSTASSEIALNEIEKVHAVLSTARRMTNDGRTIDLSAVDVRIKRLCDTIEALPTTQGRALAPALTALLAEFDSLAQELNDRFSGMPSLGDMATTKDAASAYSKTTKHFP